MAETLCLFQATQPGAARDLVLWGSLGASLLTSYGRRGLAKELLSRAEATLMATPSLRGENDLRGALRMARPTTSALSRAIPGARSCSARKRRRPSKRSAIGAIGSRR